ncbi:MAG TPA: sigma-70 family RNA polymerase sigma factor [Acidobacteriota bacterium]|nr:sigma-70 family RNA polymerase sigma factor [Acidobacteriota bacterium]
MPSEFSPEQLREVVARAREGSEQDFYELYVAFSKPIYNFVWRLIGSVEDAEDLVQETFLKVHSELKHLRDPNQFRFWLYRIARNEVYQKLRREQRATEVSIDDEEAGYYNFLKDDLKQPDPEHLALSGELNEVINRALLSLTPKYRDVFVLAVFQKMSYEDITKVVGRSLLSVKTDIYRARLMVKKAITAYMKHSRVGKE